MESFEIAGNRLCEIDGHWFAFVVDCAAIFEIQADVARPLLEGFRGRGGLFDKAAFFSHLDGDEAHKEAILEDLIECRIVDGQRHRPPLPDSSEGRTGAAGLGEIPLQTLVLHVTDACNLDCVYCYRPRRGRSSSAGEAMSLETARAAVDLLFEKSGPCREVVLVFFGGEPFLDLETVSYTAGYARRKANECGKIVHFAVTTNGTLLTAEAIRVIDEYQMGVTVSIDGFESIHDRLRPFPGGAPSSPVILPRLEALLHDRGLRPAVARVTVAQRPEAVPEILAYLLDKGFTEVGFAPVTSKDAACRLGPDGMEALLGAFESLAEEFLSCARRGLILGFSNLIDLVVHLHEGELKDYPCGAGLGLFAVAPDGGLYLCQRLTGEQDCCFGDVSRGFDNEKILRFRTEIMGKRRKECRDCWVRRICAGGCYHEALVREGGLAEPNRHYCNWVKRWVSIGLEVYGKLAATSPEYLDALSLVRGHMPAATSVV